MYMSKRETGKGMKKNMIQSRKKIRCKEVRGNEERRGNEEKKKQEREGEREKL